MVEKLFGPLARVTVEYTDNDGVNHEAIFDVSNMTYRLQLPVEDDGKTVVGPALFVLSGFADFITHGKDDATKDDS